MSQQYEDTDRGSSYNQGINLAWFFMLVLFPFHRTKMGPQLFGLIHMIIGLTIGFIMFSYGCPELLMYYVTFYIVACAINLVTYQIAVHRGENINIQHCGTSLLELVFKRDLA